MLLGLNNDISLFCNSYIGYKINSIVFISLIQRTELELIFEVLIDSFMKCFYIKFNKGKYEKLESSSMGHLIGNMLLIEKILIEK